ncbi:MAG: hypothetical protein RBR50_10440, partial [Candidatus Izemoplasmatales bacterium]|nr:hypothetical protein [Candidatus Izemoplasmatales bacterium]
MKKPTKFILKLVFIPLIVIVVIVGIPLILLSKNTVPLIEQYNVNSETEFYSMMDDELSLLITDNTEDFVQLTVNEAFINRAIQKELSKNNDKYQDENYEDDIAYNYVSIIGNNIGLTGVWTELTDDQIIVTAGANYITSKGSVLYKTGLVIIFDIVLSESNQYYLKVAKIEVGKINLGLKTTFKLANFIITTITDKSLNNLISENLSFGNFNQEELSFIVGENELTDYLYEVDPTFAALLKVIYNQDLLILDVSDEGFDISLNIGVFRRLSTDLNEPFFNRWENEFDKAEFMLLLAAEATENAFINFLNPNIDLNEADVNAILDYYLQEKVKFKLPIKFMLEGEEVEYSFDSTNLFVTMNNDVLSIHLKMTLSKIDMAGSFDMQFNLSSSVSMNSTGDMVLTIIDANLGDIDLDNETLNILFNIFDDSLMVENTLVVKKETLNSMFNGSGIV